MERPSDGATSEPLPFEYYPDPGMPPRIDKKQREHILNRNQQNISNVLWKSEYKIQQHFRKDIDNSTIDISKNIISPVSDKKDPEESSLRLAQDNPIDYMEQSNLKADLNRIHNPNSEKPVLILKTPEQSPSKRSTAVVSGCSPKKIGTGFLPRLFSRSRGDSDRSSSKQTDESKDEFKDVRTERTALKRTVSNPSYKSKPNYLTTNIVHIPLRGEEENHLTNSSYIDRHNLIGYELTILDQDFVDTLISANIPIIENNLELVAIADRASLQDLCKTDSTVILDANVDLTQSEHFALYRSNSNK